MKLASSNQHLDSTTLQHFVRRHGNAVAPAANLLRRDDVHRLGILHSDMQFGVRSDDVRPLRLPEDGQRRCRRFVKRFSRHFNRVPHSAFTSKGDNARPNRHGRTAYADGEKQAKQLAVRHFGN